MADMKVTENLFFTKTGMDKAAVDRIVGDALTGCDDGELFLEYAQSESFLFDDGRIKNASFDTSQGFGLRAVSGDTTLPIRRAGASYPQCVESDGRGCL